MYELISKVIKRIHTDPFIPQYYIQLYYEIEKHDFTLQVN